MTVPLSQLIADWLPTAGWGVLNVVGDKIVPDDDKTFYIGGNLYTHIYEDKVAGISAADPEFFEKLDKYLVQKYFGQSEWHKRKGSKSRQQIWPK